MELLDKSTFIEWMERLMGRIDELKPTETDKDADIPTRPTHEGELLLDNQEVCQMLKISKRTLQRYKDEGMPSYHIFHKTWFKESDILEFMKSHFDENLKRRRKREKGKEKQTE